jgi:putative ATP-binding cassette transporter
MFINNVSFEYLNSNGGNKFHVGPIDLEIMKGETIFIIGGNGSGKTTFAKLLTGLYKPSNGCIKINGEEINNNDLGEYYSTVFSDFFLFEKLYGINSENKKGTVAQYLGTLKLTDKVEINNNEFSTIDLSGGQKK